MADIWVQRSQEWINQAYAGVSDIAPIAADGVTGWKTMYALTRALQYELGITNRSNTFGPSTVAALQTISPVDAATTEKNVIGIVQAGMYCKGYNAGTNGEITLGWNSTLQASLNTLRSDIGVSTSSAGVSPKLFKALLTMDAYKLTVGGSSTIRSVQRALNGRYVSRRDFYVIPADGHTSKTLQQAMLYAVQYEIGMADGVANGNFGPGTKSGLESKGGLSEGDVDGSKFFVHLFQAGLILNGYSVSFSGTFNTATVQATKEFQKFVVLSESGSANLQTWAALLVSTGDPDRPGTGADCVDTLTDARMTTLRNAGYTHFGRYLLNAPSQTFPGKCIQPNELSTVFSAGGHVFPIFQTSGSSAGYFTKDQGLQDAERATNAAWAYRVPQDAVIYFAVDFDAIDSEVTQSIIPYFTGINEAIGFAGQDYRIGIYGPRNVCSRVSEAGLSVRSFVSDMSIGFSGNIGQPLPTNWAFDQIQTIRLGSGSGSVEIDKNIVSGRDSGIASLAAMHPMDSDPMIPESRLVDFMEAAYQNSLRFADSGAQKAYMLANLPTTMAAVSGLDDYVTDMCEAYGVYKALALTPLIWESLVINTLDTGSDAAVRAYYAAKEAGIEPPPGTRADSSTGLCQIKAKTAIAARAFAVQQGLVEESLYDPERWEDVWAVWQKLGDEPTFCVQTAVFEMIRASTTETALGRTELKGATPSDIQRICARYNGTGNDALSYGTRRMTLYYLICRWHESFR